MKKENLVCGGVKPEVLSEKELNKEEKNNLTEVVFILDASGSMSGLEKDTIGGMNSILKKQKEEEGETLVSTILFNTQSSVLHDRLDVKSIEPLSERDYMACGCTALLDAVGDAIKHISNVHKYIRKEDVPARTLFVITTDGMENASCRYRPNQIKEMIKRKEGEGWEFLFLGANIDVNMVAQDLGIKEDNAVEYSEREETLKMYETVNTTISKYRKTSCIAKDWGDNVNLKKRKK